MNANHDQHPVIFPLDIAQMSIGQLASLSPVQKCALAANLDQAIAWLRQARTKFDAALEQSYGQQARAALVESGRDFGTAHISEGALQIEFNLPKRVSWDQQQLIAMAERIVACGERVQDYLDVDLSVSESRYKHLSDALKAQFDAARTVKPGKPSFALTLADEEAL